MGARLCAVLYETLVIAVTDRITETMRERGDDRVHRNSIKARSSNRTWPLCLYKMTTTTTTEEGKQKKKRRRRRSSSVEREREKYHTQIECQATWVDERIDSLVSVCVLGSTTNCIAFPVVEPAKLAAGEENKKRR